MQASPGAHGETAGAMARTACCPSSSLRGLLPNWGRKDRCLHAGHAMLCQLHVPGGSSVTRRGGG